MSAFNLAGLTRGQLRAALSDAARKLAYVKETVRNIPEAYIPFNRLQEISFLEQRVGEYKAELVRRFSGTTPAHVFYSYSRRDELLMAELDGQLSGMRSEGRIKTFWDRNIGPGREWHSEITEELQDADVVLFLVSDDFLASRYCQQVELPAAIEMHNQGLIRAVPIILRPCEWQGTPLGRLQAIPRNCRPITEWTDRREVWPEVMRGVQIAIDEVRQN
jgi:TIR domain